MKTLSASLCFALVAWTLTPTLRAEAPSPAAGASGRAHPIPLGTLGGAYSRATAINDRGQIVGRSLISGIDGPEHAFLWENGVMRDLGTLGGQWSLAADINNAGQIVGVALNGNGFFEPVIWQNGQIGRLPLLPGAYDCSPTAINDRGLITGVCLFPGDVYIQVVAVLWQNGAVARMALPTGVTAFPRDVNIDGIVIGDAFAPSNELFEFAWLKGVLYDVSAIAGRRIERVGGINRYGQVAGYASTTRLTALFWDGKKLVALPDLPGTTSTTAAGLNDVGDVVGRSGPRAVLWTAGSAFELSNLTGAVLTDPVAINGRGDVIGNAVVGIYDSLTMAVVWPRTTGR